MLYEVITSAAARGNSRLAVAVWDMKLAISRLSRLASNSSSRGEKSANGMASTMCLARPVLSMARPRAIPPETSQSTSQERVLRSSLVTTRVTVKMRNNFV